MLFGDTSQIEGVVRGIRIAGGEAPLKWLISCWRSIASSLLGHSVLAHTVSMHLAAQGFGEPCKD